MSNQIKQYTEEEMRLLGKKDREFQDYLNENLSADSETYIRSHATIIGMRVHGKAPKAETLEDIMSVYEASDRRFLFALRLLSVLRPHIWGFDGLVWRIKPPRLPKAG